MWPKVDWASCRETEKPLRPDEELQPWGGGGGGEAACHPHHRQAVGSCGQDLREPGKDGPATFCHRCQCGGSSEDFPGKLCASSHIAPMMHSKIKGKHWSCKIFSHLLPSPLCRSPLSLRRTQGTLKVLRVSPLRRIRSWSTGKVFEKISKPGVASFKNI